ncbi:MAG: hypothetical protein ACYTG4_12945 [Planctomycetota bacterium]|jgi:hypothetical protein
MSDGSLKLDGDESRRGSVLGLTLLLLVAFSLMAHGTLLVARQELATSRVSRTLLAARAAAAAGLEATEGPATTRVWHELGRGQEAVVAEGALGPQRYSVVARRVGREEWLLTSKGWVAGMAGEARSGSLAWVLDPVARIASLPAVVTVAPDAAVSAAVILPMKPAPHRCGEWGPALDSLIGLRWIPGVGAVSTSPSEGNPVLGLLSLTEVHDAVSVRVSGMGTPRPAVALGRCVEGDAWSWGDPFGPAGPCTDSYPARASDGPLEAVGGGGQGLLVATGDVVLRGARFHGVILTAGSLRLLEGGQLRGAAWAAGGVEVDGSSRIEGSACAVVRAMDENRVLLHRVVTLAALGPMAGS